MILVKEKNDSESRVLTHEDNIFHIARSYVAEKGEKYFHVVNPNGDDYDLAYIHFLDLAPESAKKQAFQMCGSLQWFYEYNEYDEHDDSKIYTGFLERFNRVEIDAVDEYSVAVVKQILKNTQLPIYCTDKRLLWFVPENERIFMVDTVLEDKPKDTFRIISGIESGFEMEVFSIQGTLAAFHNMFFLQGLTKLPLSQVKYLCITFSSIVGIGGILANFMQFNRAFESYGVEVCIKEGGTRYTDKLLSKYFNLSSVPADSDESNTIFMDTILPLKITYFLSSYSTGFGEEILTDSFRKEMKEYRKAIIGDKKVLGILIRGTDYITSGLAGTRLHATVEQMIPTIDKWMEEDGYELIFLATEDQHILEKMLKKYGNKVRAVAQERYTVEELTNVIFISDLEKEKHTGQKEYEASAEDTTVNYFYALYLLSHSDSFMVSGQCNGWDTVNSFNNNKFKRCYKFQVGVEGN